jgi:hypothetical protein
MLAGCRFQAANALRPLARTITYRASNFYTDPSKNQEPGVSTSPDISTEQREILDRALRVDQAGEIAANWIYRGQFAVLGRDPRVGPLIQVSISNSDSTILNQLILAEGNVGPRKGAFRSDGQITATARGTTNIVV